MLYYLLYERLVDHVSVFNVFRYLTFRTAYAGLTALLISMLVGPWMIRKLKEFQIGQHIRDDGPNSHQKKAGTPTMGGLLIITCILFPTLLWSDLTNRFVWLVVASMLAYGLVGFWDDFRKITGRRNQGLGSHAKLIFQITVALGVGLALLFLAAEGSFNTKIIFPFFKHLQPDLLLYQFLDSFWTLPLAYFPFMVLVSLVLVGSSNAVNLTDGLDGLAIGCVVISSSALTVLCYVAGHSRWADYLDVAHLPGMGELTIFCGSMVGASLGFLWYNAFPAEIFMGDVGSLALGGAIGTVALIIKQELLLFFVGGIFVIEALSVILQVASFKLSGRRVFRMAPLHHHFELAGWTESKIIIRFWILALIFALFALTTLKIR